MRGLSPKPGIFIAALIVVGLLGLIGLTWIHLSENAPTLDSGSTGLGTIDLWLTMAVLAVLLALAGVAAFRLRREEAARAALADREARLADLMATATDWFWEADETGRFTYISGRLEEELGLRPEDFIGRTRLDLAVEAEGFDPSDIDRHRQAVEAGEAFRDFEYPIRGLGGETYWIRASGRPVRDAAGAVIGWRGTGANVTVERMLEQAVERNRALLDAVLEASPDGYFVLSAVRSQGGDLADFRLDLVNPAGLRFLGADRRDVVGKLVRRQLGTAFDPGTLALAERVMADGATLDEEQRCDFGEDHGWCRVAVAKVGDGVAVAISDITGRKGQEAAIQDLLHRLRRSNEELQTFAYAVSHDLQEPLRMVSSYLKLLVRRHGEDVSEEGREFIDFAVDGAERMHGLIQDLLTYSRVTTRGRGASEVDMDEVVDDVKRILSVAVEESEASISAPHSLPAVMADRSQMVSLLQNLVGNAIKYRSPDRAPEIVIDATERDGETVFSVADNGVGIDEKYFERIFQVFQRLKKRDEVSGSGIGLAVARRIVDRHGGRIWVESTPGEGSTFFFTIGRIMDPPEAEGA